MGMAVRPWYFYRGCRNPVFIALPGVVVSRDLSALTQIEGSRAFRRRSHSDTLVKAGLMGVMLSALLAVSTAPAEELDTPETVTPPVSKSSSKSDVPSKPTPKAAAKPRPTVKVPVKPPPRQIDRIVWQHPRRGRQELEASTVVEAQDGGLLLLSRGGQLLPVEAPQLITREPTGKPFQPHTPAEMTRQLQAEFGPGFEIITTKRYLICSNAGRPYSEWCGALFERLYFAFDNYWRQRGIALSVPEFPLVAIIFRDQRQFLTYGVETTGETLQGVTGFYDIRSNRMTMYDLTAGASATDLMARIQAAPAQISTIVHEASHQVSFNTGLQVRLADNPIWLSEGLAMFFETPDLSSKTGWKTVGAVNELRLRPFRQQLAAGRPKNLLLSLIATDDRFRDPAEAGRAYADTWALNYFLIKMRPKQYVAYLKTIGSKAPLEWDDPQARVAEFKQAFGDDLDKLETDWLNYLNKLR